MSKWCSSLTTAIPSPYPQKPTRVLQRQIHSKRNNFPSSKFTANHPYATQRNHRPTDTCPGTTATSNTIIEVNLKTLVHPPGLKQGKPKIPSFKEYTRGIPSPKISHNRLGKSREQYRLHAETNASVGPKQDSESLEESKEGTAAVIKSTKAHPMRLGFPLQKPNCAIESPVRVVVELKGDTARPERVTLDATPTDSPKKKTYKKCSCPKDPVLPCCKKAAEWIKIMFDSKGLHFDHSKYKAQYESILKADTEEPTKRANYLQIKRDLNRTFPHCEYFTEDGPGQKEMENVLTAYSKYDSQIGYVQGMNFVVGALLYHCSEDITFWLFVSLIEDHEIRDVYLPGLPGLYKHTQIIDILIFQNLRDIYSHLCEHGVKVDMFATHWIFTLFSSILPIEEMGIFFDNFFQGSWMFFYKFAIHLMRAIGKQILETEEMAEIITLIKSLKGIKVGEKLGFFEALLARTSTVSWEDIIKESYKEKINIKDIKELFERYDTETLQFNGIK